MTIKEFIDICREGDPDFCNVYHIAEEGHGVNGVQKYEPAITKLDTSVLYVVKEDKFPSSLPENGTFNFLIRVDDVTKNLDVSTEIINQCNIFVSSYTREKIIVTLQDIFFTNNQIDKALRVISEALFVSGTEKMLTVCAEQLSGAVVIVDQSGEVLERAFDPKIVGKGGKYLDFCNNTNLRTYVENIKPDFQKESNVEPFMMTKDTIVFKDNELDCYVMSKPIRVNRIEIAKILAFTTDRQYTVPDGEIISRVAQIMSDELYKKNKYKVTQRQRFVNLMYMLIDDKYPSVMGISRLMEELDIKFNGRCCVAVVHAVCDDEAVVNHVDMLNVLGTRIAIKMPDVLWTMYNDELVLVFNLYPDKDISSEYISMFKDFVYKNELSIGISHYFDNIVGVRALYVQACQAAEFGFEYLNQRLTYYNEVMHYSMMRYTQKEFDIAAMVDSNIMKMFASEKESYHEYLETLYYYLQYNGNTNAIADKMNMHRNTVLYRIDKIQQQFDLDLSDGVETMRLMLSFEILKYLRMIYFD